MRAGWMAAAAASALGLAACAGDMNMANNDTATPAAAAAAPVAATAPDDSATYVAEAARSDMYEIQSSQLALSRAASPQVKDFAKMMVADHNATTQMLKNALTGANMPASPPNTLDARRQDMLKQLSAATGPDFDRMYLQQQLTAHREALALHQGYAQSGDSAVLKGVAQQIAPKVQQHLAMVQQMAPA